MNQDQLIGWIIVISIVNGAAWAITASHIRALRDNLSRERLRNAILRERLEPITLLWRSEHHHTSRP
jgi:hypothetical protein